jgi:hypothetical protein
VLVVAVQHMEGEEVIGGWVPIGRDMSCMLGIGISGTFSVGGVEGRRRRLRGDVNTRNPNPTLHGLADSGIVGDRPVMRTQRQSRTCINSNPEFSKS